MIDKIFIQIELGWKLLKELMKYEGCSIAVTDSPIMIIKEAYKIYDFRNSGKKDFVPDIELIKRLDREFCEPMKKRRPVF